MDVVTVHCVTKANCNDENRHILITREMMEYVLVRTLNFHLDLRIRIQNSECPKASSVVEINESAQ